MKNKNYFKKAALLILLCSAQFIMAQIPSYVPTNGLVGYYPFNGNSNDLSTNANNLTNNNNVTYGLDRFSQSSSAAVFNGINQTLSRVNPNLFSGNSDRTISFWLNQSNVFTVGECSVFNIYNSSGGSGECYTSSSIMTGGNLNDNFLFWGRCNDKAFNFSRNLNTWYHIVLTYSSGQLKFYINNNLIPATSTTALAQLNTIATNLVIGGGLSSNNSNAFWNGKIDDVGVWNRALSQQEITSLYTGIPYYSDNCTAVNGSLVNGLVAYYPFCGNANDDSGHGNNGTVNGATLTTDRFGNANSAYSFNGSSSYINIPNSSSLQFSGGITYSVWFNATNIPVGAVNSTSYLMSKGSDNLATSWISYLDTGEISLRIYNTNTLNNAATVPSSQLSISTNQWYHATFTFDGTNAKAYINGVLISSVASTYTTFSNIYDLKFGRRHTSGLPYFFNGKLDDIGVWNRALTAQEVTQLYNQNQCFTNTTVTDTLVINVGQMSYTAPIAYANNITIAPNPASTQVTISFNNITDLNGGTIKIINSLGQQVATTPITTSGTNTSMTLSTWGGSGLYFVQIVNPQGQIVDIKKILLQ